MLLVISSISCLTVVSSAAGVLAYGYTPETEGEEDLSKKVLAWEFCDDGTLYLYDEPGTVSWSQFAPDLLRVELKAAPGALRCNLSQIPAAAFSGCYNLKEVDVSAGERLQSIGAYAFQGCTALTDIALDQGIISIGDYAFFECTGLKSVKFSGNLANVGKNIFKNCTSLETAIIPNGVLAIGYGMFENCINLKTANLPDSVTTIDNLAFSECVSLEQIIVPDSTTDVGENAFYGCTSAKTVYIGHNAEKIGKNAFSKCTSLESVEIACAMSIISEGMFMDCTSLSSINIEEGVEVISKNAFKGCSSLSAVVLPSSLKTIGDSAFNGTALTEINIPADVEGIEKGAFTNCVSLANIFVDKNNDYFYSVDGVLYDVRLNTVMLCPAGKTGEITIGEGVTSIGDDAFIGCQGVTKVIVPDSVMQIASNAFNDTSLIIKANCNSEAIKFAKVRGIATEITHAASLIWQTKVEPDCLNKGTEELVCSGCGDVSDSREIVELGHSYDDGVITTKPTCETDGVVTFTCTREGCLDSYTDVLPKTEHAWNTGEVIVEATCTTVGTKRFSCQNTGCYDYHDVEIPVLNHSFDNGVVTIEKTCTTDGEVLFSCTRDNCSEHYTDVISATGHNYQANEVKKATCLDNGKIIYTCLNCGDSYEEITTGEHIPYSTPVKVNPTCTEEGEEGVMCSICHQFIGATTKIPVAEHTYINGKCSDCGATDGSTPSNPGGTVVTPEGGSGNSGTATSKPATPKLLSVKNRNEGLVFEWKAVEGAKAYRVYRRAEGAKSWTYLTTVTDTKYVDSKAEAGVYWRYTVRATNDAGLSGYENGIYIKRVETPKMKSVANVSTGVKVTWNAVEGADSYKVYRRIDGGKWQYLATVKGGTSYTDKSLAANNSGTKYRYTVRALDGYMSYFEAGLSLTYVATPSLKSVANVSKGVKVTWGAVKGADSYKVYRRSGNGAWKCIATVKASKTSYVDNTLKNTNSGTNYKYTVRAIDSGKYSSFKSGLAIKFVATPGLKSIANTSNGAKLTWGAVNGVDSYKVYRSTNGGSWKCIATVKSGTSYTDASVKNATGTYKYTVRAIDQGTYSSFKAGLTIKK